MQLLTPQEAAERMHVTLKMLRQLRAEGQIRYIAITDRKILYLPEDCDAWIATRVRRDEAQPVTRRRAKPAKAVQRRSAPIVPFTQRPR